MKSQLFVCSTSLSTSGVTGHQVNVEDSRVPWRSAVRNRRHLARLWSSRLYFWVMARLPMRNQELVGSGRCGARERSPQVKARM